MRSLTILLALSFCAPMFAREAKLTRDASYSQGRAASSSDRDAHNLSGKGWLEAAAAPSN